MIFRRVISLFQGWFPSLASRDYRRFLVAQVLSLTGNWMHITAESWLVLEMTHSPAFLGLVGALRFGPTLVFSLFAGLLADRFPKRNLLIGTRLMLFMLATLYGWLTLSGHLRPWMIAALALAMGSVSTLDWPTRQAFVIEMVGPKVLMNALALHSSIFNLARLGGPALAGALMTRLPIGMVFLLNALGYLLSAMLFLTLQAGATAPHRPDRREGMLKPIQEGVRYAWRSPFIRSILALLLVIGIFSFNFQVLVPVYARKELGLGPGGFGLLLSSLGGGALVGALVVAYLARQGPRVRFLFWGGLGFTLGQVALWTTLPAVWTALFLALVGFSMVFALNAANTLIQIQTPDALRGRVISLFTLILAGSSPLGNLVSGWVAEHLSAPLAFGVGGLIGALGVVGFLSPMMRAPCREAMERPCPECPR